ncbi:hypothetical protein BOX15_Mlig021471g1, partial [Macrostomum lignano]
PIESQAMPMLVKLIFPLLLLHCCSCWRVHSSWPPSPAAVGETNSLRMANEVRALMSQLRDWRRSYTDSRLLGLEHRATGLLLPLKAKRWWPVRSWGMPLEQVEIR